MLTADFYITLFQLVIFSFSRFMNLLTCRCNQFEETDNDPCMRLLQRGGPGTADGGPASPFAATAACAAHHLASVDDFNDFAVVGAVFADNALGLNLAGPDVGAAKTGFGYIRLHGQ
jgi:hypothetical protein